MTEPALRRAILLPIDLYGVDPVSLESLVDIARRLDRNLLGLFLDDPRLREIADLPFSTEIVLSSGRERGLERRALIQRQDKISTDIRRRLDDLARRYRVGLNFEHGAGTRGRSGLQQPAPVDIFFAPRRSWRSHFRSRLAPALPRLGLLLQGDQSDRYTTAAAANLLKARMARDVCLMCAAISQEQLRALDLAGSRVCVQSGLQLKPQTVLALIRQSSCQLLLVPRNLLQGIDARQLDAALDASSSEVLVINETGG